MADSKRQYTIGIGPGIAESSVTPCGLNLTSWTPPLPKTCQRPGMMIEIFDLLARRMKNNYSILFIDNRKYGIPDQQGNFSGQVIIERTSNDRFLRLAWFNVVKLMQVCCL